MAGENTPTPMMVQYLGLKAKAGDCLLFYRMGDFFELFFDDARAAAATLDIALTSRGEHDGTPIPMCGVPVHAAEGYLARLIKAGHRVAIAEQTESPEQAKARGGKTLVTRDIVRFVTAGTLTEDSLLDSWASNMLVAVAQVGEFFGLAAADISTGYFELLTVTGGSLEAELARLSASELVVPEGLPQSPPDAIIRPRADFESTVGGDLLRQHFALTTLGSIGPVTRAEQAAAGGLISYLAHAGQGKMPFLKLPVRREVHEHLLIDQATRDSLEINSASKGGRAGSLLAEVDRTITGAGARQLASDLAAPLMDKAKIDARLSLVQWFHDAPLTRDAVRAALRQLPDIARALGRVVAGRGSPRDLGQIRDGLDAARVLRERLGGMADRPELLDHLLPVLDGHGHMVDLLVRALVTSPPTDTAQGGYIAEGYDAALDVLRVAGRDGRQAIAQLEARYRDATGVAALKIRHNAVLGYFVEVPAKHGDALMAPGTGFTHRQTMAGAVRFNSPELHEEALRITQAGGHALAAEAAHLEKLIALILNRRDPIAASADALARIDVSAALAERAAESNWCRPSFFGHPCLEIQGGRHPIVESALAKSGDRFIANDCKLSPEKRLWLVSGPNMGGKSTFLRQNALIVLLAQAGSYVPANAARLGLVDRLFSRVGASDNLARGRSTFMVEMVETAAILAQATERSFVILDEVGRGTSTYDGLAIAWAVVEGIHETNRCRCLFATHYHELTRLSESLDALSLHHVRAKEYKGDLVLLHELADGPADRSYGIAVAKLAGLPPQVVARASGVLGKLEKGRAETGGLAAGLGDLPLFSAAMDAAEAKVDALREKLSDLDIDALSPRAALDLLYELKRAAGES
ncbi:DNA mismatch repair protein MutS [Sphingorhabdus sp.]|uniref:DNA mismatch repair protein MutS n=1 Tax=Sphingorhabdus sp. TaxID=1902408 RepID=UPI002634BDA0|nr:DNA mismatch repair protein MutS [Sphingorhabdus sp.]MDH4399933.1 DNA mismatch repair protein MutS [Sphingorhabdus sp.]